MAPEGVAGGLAGWGGGGYLAGAAVLLVHVVDGTSAGADDSVSASTTAVIERILRYGVRGALCVLFCQASRFLQ